MDLRHWRISWQTEMRYGLIINCYSKPSTLNTQMRYPIAPRRWGIFLLWYDAWHSCRVWISPRVLKIKLIDLPFANQVRNKSGRLGVQLWNCVTTMPTSIHLREKGFVVSDSFCPVSFWPSRSAWKRRVKPLAHKRYFISFYAVANTEVTCTLGSCMRNICYSCYLSICYCVKNWDAAWLLSPPSCMNHSPTPGPNLGQLEWWNGQLHLLITPHQCRMRMRARSTSFRNHFSSSLHSAYLYTNSTCFQCIVNAYMYSKYLYTSSICFTSILSAWFVYSRFQKKNCHLNTNTEGCGVSYQQMFSQLTSLVQYTLPEKQILENKQPSPKGVSVSYQHIFEMKCCLQTSTKVSSAVISLTTGQNKIQT